MPETVTLYGIINTRPTYIDDNSPLPFVQKVNRFGTPSGGLAIFHEEDRAEEDLEHHKRGKNYSDHLEIIELTVPEAVLVFGPDFHETA
jgi:hypothetical protein